MLEGSGCVNHGEIHFKKRPNACYAEGAGIAEGEMLNKTKKVKNLAAERVEVDM